MAQATATTKAFNNSLLGAAQRHAAAFNTIGIAALAFGGMLAFAMKGAADAAIEFESSFAGVRKTVDATETEFAALAQGFRDMAKEIPVNVNELNRIGEAAGQLGIKKEAILEFTDVVAKLGATTNLVGDQAATAMARIANVMQTPQDQFDQMGATIVALGNAGASTEAEIVEMAMRIAGAGKIVGLTEAEVLSFANALSSVGIEAQLGGSAISRVFVDIASSVESGGEKLEDFAAVAGMSASEFQRAFEQDAAGAMVSFIEGLGRLDAAGGDVFGTLEQLGLSEVRVRDALLRAAGAGDLFRESLELGNTAWEENNALNEEAAKRFGTTASQTQLATNRINDAAISFGQLMLPAIAAVMQAIGGFADIIGSLPGPVKAAVLVTGALATAMLLLGGATLLLLPRIAAVKAEFAKAGISGGLFRGSLTKLAGAINPVTIGITAATIVIGAYAQQKAAARARVEEFTSAIEADTGALGENTKAVVVNQLQQAGLLAVFEDMGVPADQVTDDILAMADGSQTAARSLKQLAESMDGWDAIVLLGVLNSLADGMDAAALKADALGDSTEGAAGGIEGASGATGEFVDITEEAVSAADEFTEALEALAGVTLDVEKASLAWLDSLASLRDELRQGARTLDDSTQAGRDNRSAILDSIDAAIAHGAAVAEQTGSVEAGARATRKHINELIDQAAQAGIAKGEIKDYIRELNLTPSKIKTLIQLLGIDAAQAAIDRFITLNSGRVVKISIGTTGGVVQHAGGMVGSGAMRLHGGGRVPMRGDEVPIIAKRGERVLNPAQNRQWEGMNLQPAAAPGGSGTVVNVTAVVNGNVVGRNGMDELASTIRTNLLRQRRSLGTLGLS